MTSTAIPSKIPPYGPPANIKTIIDFWRDRNMPEQVTREWLTRIGISGNLTTHNLAGLKFLGLVDEEGYPTPEANELRVAPSDEYQGVLEKIVRKAYARIFEVVDPTQDSRTRVVDVFRQEEPSAQRSRMVTFFLGMCAMAGIPLKEAPPKRQGTQQSRVGQPRRSKSNGEGVKPPTPPPVHREDQGRRLFDFGDLRQFGKRTDPVLAVLLDRVSTIETVEQLDQWFGIFRAAFEFSKATTPRVEVKNEVEDDAQNVKL